MKLYHGTLLKHLPSIQRDGIRPRGKRKGNWKEYPSRHDMVYLTSAYAPFFAMCANAGGDPLVLEIDTDILDKTNFYPDEDIISQSISQNEKKPLKEVHKQVREHLTAYQQYWQLSLEKIGNCCYRGIIPPAAITRYVTWNVKKQISISMMAMDPTITPINFLLLKGKYVGLIEWLFGDRSDIPTDLPDFEVKSEDESFNKLYAEQAKHWNEASKNRESIIVVNNYAAV